MVDVLWWNKERMSFACCGMLNEHFDAIGARHHVGYGLDSQKSFPDLAGVVVVFHGGQMAAYGKGPGVAAVLSVEVKDYDWVLFISIGDESSEFPLHLLKHPNMKIWAQTPKPGRTIPVDRVLVEGYPSDCYEMLARTNPIERDLAFFFAGQVTHERRDACMAALRPLQGGKIVETKSFGAGLPHDEYYALMKRAKIVPCPAGPATPDSFRMAEALEAGAVPILDAYALDHVPGYWDLVFGPDHPLWVVEDWSMLPEIMAEILADYPRVQRLTQHWWKQYKIKFRLWLGIDIVLLQTDEEYQRRLDEGQL